MAGVGVVTDSTSSLEAAEAARAGVELVPLQVIIDGLSRAEQESGEHPGAGVAPVAEEVAAALRSGRAVSTSRPTPEAFSRAYAQVRARGAESIVSVHLSSRISGTVDAARRAATLADLPVLVVDTATAAMAVGDAALAAAAAAAAGASAEEAAEAARRCAAETSVWFCVASLEHLRRGGRIGAAQALVGSALAVKPLLTVQAGAVAPFERVRTLNRATARLAALAAGAVTELRRSGRAADVTVHHVADPTAGRRLAERIESEAQLTRLVRVRQLSAVLAVHVGPGTLGVVVAPRDLSPA